MNTLPLESPIFSESATVRDQARGLRALIERREAVSSVSDATPRRTSRTIAVTSGKGGVGKSHLALNLAVGLAQEGASVCLLDGNLGLGSIDLLCGLNGYWNLSHVITGARTLQDVLLEGPAGVQVIPGASGITDVADCPLSARQDILRQLEELEETYDYLVIDTGSGIHRLVRQFSTTADLTLIVTTPEPTAMADAYATVKSLSATLGPELQVIVNQADTPEQGRAIIERLQQTSRLFLHIDLGAAGCVPRDAGVPQAVLNRTPFLLAAPHSPAARAVRQLAQRIHTGHFRPLPRETFFSRLWQRIDREAA
jgi:flagellar biosynthesis protein FlhG